MSPDRAKSIIKADVEARNWVRQLQVGDYYPGVNHQAEMFGYPEQTPEWYSFIFAAASLPRHVLTDATDLITFVQILEEA